MRGGMSVGCGAGLRGTGGHLRGELADSIEHRGEGGARRARFLGTRRRLSVLLEHGGALCLQPGLLLLRRRHRLVEAVRLRALEGRWSVERGGLVGVEGKGGGVDDKKAVQTFSSSTETLRPPARPSACLRSAAASASATAAISLFRSLSAASAFCWCAPVAGGREERGEEAAWAVRRSLCPRRVPGSSP